MSVGALRRRAAATAIATAMMAPMRVYLGSDHAGLGMKQAAIAHLREQGHEAIDCGPIEYDPDDDYPPFCIDAARRAVADPGSLGVVIGGSNNGEQIAANKVDGVRCALLGDETARTWRASTTTPMWSPSAPGCTRRRGAGLPRQVPRHPVLRRRAAHPPNRPAAGLRGVAQGLISRGQGFERPAAALPGSAGRRTITS